MVNQSPSSVADPPVALVAGFRGLPAADESDGENRLVAIALRRVEGFAEVARGLSILNRGAHVIRLNDHELVFLLMPPLLLDNSSLYRLLLRLRMLEHTFPTLAGVEADPFKNHVSIGWLEEQDLLANPGQYEKILSVVNEQYPIADRSSADNPSISLSDHLQVLQRTEAERRVSAGAILASIESTNRGIAELTDRLGTEVMAARRADITWREIGAALGITDSAAYRRFDPEGHRKHSDYRRAQRDRDSRNSQRGVGET